MSRWLSALLRVVLFCAGLAVTILPRRLELVIGPWLGRLLLKIGRKRREVAHENIRRCFKELGPEGWDRLLRANYEHYGVLALELMHMFSPIAGHYARYARRNVRVSGVENWKNAAALGHGVLFVSSHLGNWELMVSTGGIVNMPVTMVTKHLKPEWLHLQVEAARASLGVKAAYEPRTLPVVMRALRAGESVGFVIDQYAGPPIGIPVPFFGVKVGTLAAVGVLAARTGAVVVPVETYRGADGMIHVSIQPRLELGEAIKDEEKTTASLARHVEGWVRGHPSQWLWIHRRFKNVVWPKEIT